MSQFANSSPGARESYRVVEEIPGKGLTLAASLSNGLEATRSFELLDGKLTVTSSYRNSTDHPVEVTFRPRPQLRFDKFSFVRFITPSTDGVNVQRMAGVTLKEYAVPIDETAEEGWGLLANQGAASGFLVTFSPEDVREVYAFQAGPGGYDSVNLELFGRPVTVAPGATWATSVAYRVVEDAEEFTKR